MDTAHWKYKYVIDSNCRKTSAQKRAVLNWVNSNSGFGQTGRKPTEAEFIAEASRKGSEMYKAGVLELDVQRAAKKLWVSEAQYYLRHINVVAINIETKVTTPPVRAYIGLNRARYGRIDEYKTAKRVADNPSLKSTVLERAQQELQAWMQRYERHEQFFDIRDMAIKELRKWQKQQEGDAA